MADTTDRYAKAYADVRIQNIMGKFDFEAVQKYFIEQNHKVEVGEFSSHLEGQALIDYAATLPKDYLTLKQIKEIGLEVLTELVVDGKTFSEGHGFYGIRREDFDGRPNSGLMFLIFSLRSTLGIPFSQEEIDEWKVAEKEVA